MPAVVALIVCKTVLAGPEDQNAAYTGYQNRDWAIENGKMVCQRHEIQLEDSAMLSATPTNPADPKPFTPMQCQHDAIMAGVRWDAAHQSGSYRFFMAACPVPVVDKRTGQVLAWHTPECGHREIMVCDLDEEI